MGLDRTQQNELLWNLRHTYAERLPVNVPEVPVENGVADAGSAGSPGRPRRAAHRPWSVS
ncbi:hypothetical protein AB0A69_07060 [Streptomyces sp. NPDC045431]|uniref:hypothetical protein n=1 Tax=Streptomyces sp. NPDC045431 TaxID=3155613 RepID=UPI0033DB917E